MACEFNFLILAAGKGTRIKSSVAKVLNPILGKPMIFYLLDTLQSFPCSDVTAVVGYQSELVKNQISSRYSDINFVVQSDQRGTADAVMSAKILLQSMDTSSSIVILSGDVPFVSKDTIQMFVEEHDRSKTDASVLSVSYTLPHAYGRIIRKDGKFSSIKEVSDLSDSEQSIHEVNTGIYCFKIGTLLRVLELLEKNKITKEYHLTDVFGCMYDMGQSIHVTKLESTHLFEVLGINNKFQIIESERVLQKSIIDQWIERGVYIQNPMYSYIETDVDIGEDTQILQGSMLKGKTKIGKGCVIGPNSIIEDSVFQDNVHVHSSYVSMSKVCSNVSIGPFSHLRKGNHVQSDVKIGNFSELKNSRIGRSTKIPHLSYVGDADVGENVNFGAGSIVCNYDGKKKYRTEIQKDVLIGANVNMVAPIKIQKNSVIGAGSTISKDVPEGSLIIERSLVRIKKNLFLERNENG